MRPTPDPARLFSDRTESYARFVRFVRYPEGIRSYFLRSPLLRSGLRVLDAGCGAGIVTLALRDALDLVVSASMLEYVPRTRLAGALSGLRSLLEDGGSLVLFITRRNWLTRPLIGRWWRSNLYDAGEIEEALRQAGFGSIRFCRFPSRFRHLGLWGHVVEAHG
jgi:cyclopropane fatty-acyl-phospholipid synthase-like methyltransferase